MIETKEVKLTLDSEEIKLLMSDVVIDLCDDMLYYLNNEEYETVIAFLKDVKEFYDD